MEKYKNCIRLLGDKKANKKENMAEIVILRGGGGGSEIQSFSNPQYLDSIEHGFSFYNNFFLKNENLISACDLSDFMYN